MAAAGGNSVNRKAFFDYEIAERIEAGIVLEGWEVKALRAGRGQIKGAHAIIRAGEMFLVGMQITPLEQASTHKERDPMRTRKLLLSRAQIDSLTGKVEKAGWTLIPLNMHWSKNLAKIEIGLGKGKKLSDKREAGKEADAKREIEREFAKRRRDA